MKYLYTAVALHWGRLLKRLGLTLVIVLTLLVGGAFATLHLYYPLKHPVPANPVAGNQAAMLERGKYLAHNVSGCFHCHSPMDFSRLNMPIDHAQLGAGFAMPTRLLGMPADLYVPNITPAGIKDYSDEDLFRIITTGVRPNGSIMFPFMPYPMYGQMDPQDVYSIIAYLRTLPAVEKANGPSSVDFPVSSLMRINPDAPKPMLLANLKTSEDRGKYLVTAAGCGDCHTQKDKGVDLPGMHMAGGMPFNLPTGGTVYSANLTPHNTGLGPWSQQRFVARFKSHLEHQEHPQIQPNSFNTVMGWDHYAQMTEQDLSDIYAYLRTLDPVDNSVVKFKPGKAG